MRKNKISSSLKNEPSTEEQIINLKLEMPEKMIINFKGEQNDQVIKEIQHVLKDDDTDLFYYDPYFLI
jgi:hypothetical protein